MPLDAESAKHGETSFHRGMRFAAVGVARALVSSAVVAAVVAAVSTFLTQRYLLERKARIDYEYMARNRLYEEVGPLRMQLLSSARDVTRRTRQHAERDWNMDPSGVFVRSSVYRLLRPLAVSQLIEGKMSVADFSVDPAALALPSLQYCGRTNAYGRRGGPQSSGR